MFTSKLISRIQDGAEVKPKKSGSATPGQPIISKIQDVAAQLFELQGLDNEYQLTQCDLDALKTSRQLVTKVLSLLDFFLRAQGAFLASLCKFSYLSQRIFLYLIYQGFCGQEDESDPQE